MSYYEPHSDPVHGARLSVNWDRPTLHYQDGEMIRSMPGGRTRVIIEGESELVERIRQAMDATVNAIKGEIEA